MSKFVLCRPCGGLNDILCQIEHCWNYSIKYNRTLIIDTTQSSLNDEFSNYFEVQNDLLILKIPNWMRKIFVHFVPKCGHAEVKLELNLKDISPFQPNEIQPNAALDPRLDYEISYVPEIRNFVRKGTKEQLTFPRHIPHEERILLHHQCGGGERSKKSLRRLKLKKEVSDEIINRLKKIEKPYSAIHIRNTDLKTDYVSFFEEIAPEVRGKNILICSDDSDCIEYAKTYFTNSNIMSISNIPNTEGKALHYHRTKDKYKTNIDSLADLVALALSKKVYTTKSHKDRFSGFSRLAINLNKRKRTVFRLLGVRARDI